MDIFELLDLDYKGLEEVKKYYESKDIYNAKRELKKYFYNRKSVLGFIDKKDEIISYAKNNLKNEIDITLNIANELIKKEISFTLPWEMERCKDVINFNDEIDWSLNPNNDDEWTFMLSRHRFLTSLTEAYMFTDNKSYLETLNYIIYDWINKNKDKEKLKNKTWRTIEAGIRIKNWIKSLEVLLKYKEIDEDLLCKIIISIHEHLKYLHENNKYERVLSNWVILEQQGAFIAQVFLPELKITNLYREETIKTLGEAITFQVMEDGLHWEQSFQYHNEMLKCFLEMLVLAEKNNIKIPQIIKSKTMDMAYATLYIMKPNHCQSNYGDSDEEDLRSILNLSALIFDDEVLRNYGNDRIDLSTLLIYGYQGINKFNNLGKRPVENPSKAFTDTGLYFMRTGFLENDSYSMFKCGFLGSGHGHADTLHLEVTCIGEDILVDSGRYTYSPKKEERIELKRPKSHNTNIINDIDFTVCSSSWGNTAVATPIKSLHKFKEQYEFVEGGHLGYINNDNSTVVNRKVIFIKPDIWVISDEFFTNAENQYTQFYNFNKPKVEKSGRNKLKYVGDKVNFYIETLNDNGEFIIEESYTSKDYNEIYISNRGIFNLRSKSNTFINTVMYGSDKKDKDELTTKYIDVYDWQGKKMSKDIVEALYIKYKQDSYTVILVHREDPKGRKLYLVNGNRVYGRVAVIKESNSKTKLEVLSY